MEMWIIAPLMLGAIASATLVVLSVKLWVDGVPPDRKALIGAIMAAISGFLTTSLISWAGDKEDSRLAKRIKRIFQTKYQRGDPDIKRQDGVRYFVPGSTGEQLVHSENLVSGWGPEARRTRAKKLANELGSGTSDA